MRFHSPPCLPERAGSLGSSLSAPSSLLLRLLASEMCGASMTLQYLHTASDKEVVACLGAKLFTLAPADVDRHIPQLVHLLLTRPHTAAEAIRPYLTKRCASSPPFALDCIWLLEAARDDAARDVQQQKEKSDPAAFRALIAAESALAILRHAATGRGEGGIDAACECECLEGYEVVGLDECWEATEEGDEEEEKTREGCGCGYSRLRAAHSFVRGLVDIGERLRMGRSREEKSHRLIAELDRLNAQVLPARVWLPLYAHDTPHLVLRVPPEAACVLNSKDKAPYCIYVEVLRCEEEDPSRVRVPQRFTEIALDDDIVDRPEGCAPLWEDGGGVEGDEESEGGGRRMSGAAAVNEKNWLAAESPSLAQQQENGSTDSWGSVEAPSLASWTSVDERQPKNGRRRCLKEWSKRKPSRQQMRHTPEDPSAAALSEPWEEKRERLRLCSPYGHLPGWALLPAIVKTGDDLRVEQMAYQILRECESVWQEEGVPLLLRPYKIVVLSAEAGMLEPVVNAASLHQIKRNLSSSTSSSSPASVTPTSTPPSLLGHFREAYGREDSRAFQRAQNRLMLSAAAYSLVCYLLQVKDRHNGNILLAADGALIHIDFGFVLGASPRGIGFETAPFKLTSEIVDAMGGVGSDTFRYYKYFMLQGLIAARKHVDRIVSIVEIMAEGSSLSCFRAPGAGAACVAAMRDRFHLTATDAQLEAILDRLVEESRDALSTRLYDNYQYYTNGIL